VSKPASCVQFFAFRSSRIFSVDDGRLSTERRGERSIPPAGRRGGRLRVGNPQQGDERQSSLSIRSSTTTKRTYHGGKGRGLVRYETVSKKTRYLKNYEAIRSESEEEKRRPRQGGWLCIALLAFTARKKRIVHLPTAYTPRDLRRERTKKAFETWGSHFLRRSALRLYGRGGIFDFSVSRFRNRVLHVEPRHQRKTRSVIGLPQHSLFPLFDHWLVDRTSPVCLSVSQ